MIIRENSKIKRNSTEYEVIKRQILDLFVVSGNATACYNLWRRAIGGEDFKKSSNTNTMAAKFFKTDENRTYIEQRKIEVARWGFEQYAILQKLDISDFKKKEDKYTDIENLTPDELRTKSLTELEEQKNATDDPLKKAQIIKMQTDLMDAKRKDEEEQNTEKFIHFYLPTPYCNECPNKENRKTATNPPTVASPPEGDLGGLKL